jgi:tryptophanyl-tRNA synthetase
MGELSRMTQFKEKAETPGAQPVGLFTYPVLMAADILLYNADAVPVGDDQRQHLELARDIAERFNARYGETFTVPAGAIPTSAARVMDLQEPTRKMSKSVSSPLGTIGLSDAPGDIEKKVKKAVTDTDGEVRYDPEAKPGTANLLDIFAVLTNEQPQAVADRYTRYGDLKGDLAAAIIEVLSPIAERYNVLMSDPAELQRLLGVGSQRAGEVAALRVRTSGSGRRTPALESVDPPPLNSQQGVANDVGGHRVHNEHPAEST